LTVPEQPTVIDQRLLSLLSRVSGRPEQDIELNMPLLGKGLGLDSLSGTILLTALEAEFGVTLADIDLHMDALDSVGSLQAFLQRHEEER
jgi:acyl carrier protein